MAYTVPETEPATLVAGDLWTWTKRLDDYPAGDNWTLSYVIRVNGRAPLTITATGSGTTHTVSVEASTTATYPTGVVYWQSYVTNSSTNARHTLESGRFTVRQNLASTSVYDPRSIVKKTLDAIEATLLNTAQGDEAQMTVDGIAIGLRTPEQLLMLRDKYYALYQQELRTEAIAAGKPNSGKLVFRFRRPGL